MPSMTKKKKQQPKTNAEAVRDHVKRRKAAGLIQAKVWVHPEEADAVRRYAARKPKTKEILQELN